ncbi:MAG: TIM barrel protein [Ferruginibacter sp.]
MNNLLQFFCPLWGSEALPFDRFLSTVKAAGYDGVEMSFPMDAAERDQLVKMVKSAGLQLVGQHWETVDNDFETHLRNYQQRLHNLVATEPLFINSQTGKDYYSFEQNAALINAAADIATRSGIPIIHETHRGKFSFAAHVTRQYLDRIPGLQLCLDISHWCCVAETLLHDQEDAVNLAIEHTRHIHSRVGFIEGPQVMDPRAPEWEKEVGRHIDWWRKIVQKNNRLGIATTITTEFGPAPYLQHFPYTRQPIYNQWEVNIHMMQLLRSAIST